MFAIAGDTLVLYGRGERLGELDRRPGGAEGDSRHARAIRAEAARGDDAGVDPVRGGGARAE